MFYEAYERLVSSVFEVCRKHKNELVGVHEINEFSGRNPWNRMFFQVGDITKVDTDAIVNAANNSLLGGGGVDGAIHKAAGPELLNECKTLNGCKTGEAKITKGYNLSSKYVIHTVGPVYGSDALKESKLLEDCYNNSLELAKENDIHSIAFPAISTGAYGYPADIAARIAVKTVSRWLTKNRKYEMKVIFVSYDEKMNGIMQKTARRLKDYLDSKWS